MKRPLTRRALRSTPASPATGEGKEARTLQAVIFRLLPLHRLPADVAAAEAFGPIDAVDRLIGALLRFGDGLAGGADVQHAAAIGENLPSLATVPAWKISTPSTLAASSSPSIARAFAIIAGIALGRQDHGERDLVVPTQVEMPELRRPRRRSGPAARSDIIRSISTWDSGSPKRALYSTSFGPSLVTITPTKSTPLYGVPIALSARKRRHDHPFHRPRADRSVMTGAGE